MYPLCGAAEVFLLHGLTFLFLFFSFVDSTVVLAYGYTAVGLATSTVVYVRLAVLPEYSFYRYMA